MSPGQRLLIIRSLGAAGLIAIIGIFALLAYGVNRMVTEDRTVAWFFGGLLDISDGGSLFYPLLAVAIVSLWVRAFLIAGDPGQTR